MTTGTSTAPMDPPGIGDARTVPAQVPAILTRKGELSQPRPRTQMGGGCFWSLRSDRVDMVSVSQSEVR